MNTATAITVAALAALTPTVTALVGIVMNNQRLSRIEARMDSIQSQSHGDALLILRSMTELHERVAKVETRQA